VYLSKSGRFSSHQTIMRLALATTGDRSIADLGCGEGFVLEGMRDAGWRTWGIDPDSSSCQIAANKGLSVDNLSLEQLISKRQTLDFSVIVLGDVLEHLVDPWDTLRDLVNLSSPGTSFIISVPNVAHVSVRVLMLFGLFRYQSRGILDRTHLRFFDRKSAIKLVRQAGLKILAYRVTPVPVELIFPRPFNESLIGRFAGFLNWLVSRSLPSLLGYQFVFLCLTEAREAE
jgi:2-polyprenyl-3-methyl-5-hydroxy-6-metoxy-1,4-benzoquinol methylase